MSISVCCQYLFIFLRISLSRYLLLLRVIGQIEARFIVIFNYMIFFWAGGDFIEVFAFIDVTAVLLILVINAVYFVKVVHQRHAIIVQRNCCCASHVLLSSSPHLVFPGPRNVALFC